MKFRRVRESTTSSPILQICRDGLWQTAEPDSPLALLSRFDVLHPGRSAGLALPVQPLSFRDFMLFEKHVVDASRGYAKRFLPIGYRVSKIYETLTGRVFPAFRPKPLWHKQPIYYMSNHLAFVPSGTPVKAPSYSHALDYELELGFILGKPLYNASPQEAVDAIAAFVVLNDFSARDVQREEMLSGFGPQKSKHFLSSMSDTGVTADAIQPVLSKLTARVRINGHLVTTTSLKDMRYSLGQVLAHTSKNEPLFAGELFGTGTLPGGSGMESGHWLQPGDELVLEMDGIGQITHRILK